jgi:hypothetical protein
MVKRNDIRSTARGQMATVTADQEQRLRETLSRLGIKSPPLSETSREESVQRLSDFEQEGGE